MVFEAVWPGSTVTPPSPLTLHSGPGSASLTVYAPGMRLFRVTVVGACSTPFTRWNTMSWPVGYDGPVTVIVKSSLMPEGFTTLPRSTTFVIVNAPGTYVFVTVLLAVWPAMTGAPPVPVTLHSGPGSASLTVEEP